MVDTTSQRGSAFSQLKGTVQYDTPPAVLSSKITDGGTFIVISRTRQGEEPQVWATGDEQQTQQLFDQVARMAQPTT
jgi:hypothetical protein